MICRPPRAGSANCARHLGDVGQRRRGGFWKNVGCAIPPVAVRPAIAKPRFRLRAGACLSLNVSFETCVRANRYRLAREALEDVPPPNLNSWTRSFCALGHRHGIVETQRTERRRPDQAGADRGADDVAVLILQAEYRYLQAERWSTGDATGRVDFAGATHAVGPL